MLIQIFYKQKNTIQSFTDSKFTKWTPILYIKSLLSSYSSNCSVSLIKTRIDLRSSEFYVSPIAAGKGLNFAACRKNMITIFEFTFKWMASLFTRIDLVLSRGRQFLIIERCLSFFLLPSSLNTCDAVSVIGLSEVKIRNWITAGYRKCSAAQREIES